MTDKIRVLIVDDLPETRENVRKLLQFEPDVEVVGVAGDGDQAIEGARQYKPDVILMDINMPGIDGIGASQTIVKSVPNAQIIIMSVQSEADYLRRAMLAGARDFLMKPFSGDELMAAIRRVYETRPAVAAAVAYETTSRSSENGAGPAGAKGHIITVYSPKGGAGCTTLAMNLAVGLASHGHNTILVDASLQFGDIAVSLNMRPVTTIIDLVDRLGEIDADLVSSVALKHNSGLRVLLAPPRPEMADLVTAEQLEGLLRRLSQLFDFVIVDTPTGLNDVTLATLDIASRILLVTQQSLSSLTGTRRFFDLVSELNYDLNKVMLVINRASAKFGISAKDVAEALKRPVIASIDLDEFVATSAADRGTPLISVSGKRSPMIGALHKLTERLEAEFALQSAVTMPAAEPDQGKSKSLFGRLLGR